MISLNKLPLFGGLLLLIILTGIAGYAYSQVRYLSLPISQVFAFFSVILPIAIGISTQTARQFLPSQTSNLSQSRSTLYLILLLAFQLIYETVIVTIALTGMVPSSSLNCELDEQWAHLRQTKNADAIRRIQDRYDCCGFKTVLDRAWPFESKDVDAHACESRFERTRSCVGPWRQAEQINAGLFFTVATVIFVTKIISLIVFFTTPSSATTTSWFHSRPFRHITAGETDAGRRQIGGGEPEQEYHDEYDSREATNPATIPNGDNFNGSRPRIEPSGLTDAGEAWRDEH